MAAVSLHERPVDRVLAKLPGHRKAGRGWMARCPSHDDREASLSVSEGRDGRVLLNCHAGCTSDAIVSQIGLAMADLFAAPLAVVNGKPKREEYDPTKRPVLQKTYDYTDADGNLLFQSMRFAIPDTPPRKKFKQRRPDGNGNWINNIEGVVPVLYRLPDVIEAAAMGRPIYVVEGEKDADALAELGYCATTSPMGAGKWRDAYADTLAKATVIVLPDNDDAGRAHAEQVAASCTAKGAVVKVVPLPGVAVKGDVSDWLDAGHDLDELDALVGKAATWSPDPSKRTRWTLRELWENDSIMRPPPAIVPRIAWAGRSTVLSAREKMGKSTLLGYVTAKVTTGGAFLGEPCQVGTVLVFTLEEFVGDTARRLRHFGADPDRVVLVDRFLGDPRTRPDELRAHVEAVDPVLVIVDSLTAYSNGQIQDDNNATQMAAVVQPLTDVVHQLGAALLLIHHARKSDGKARGSTAIVAAADVACEMYAPEEDADPTLRRMRSVGRVPVPRLYDFRYDGRDYALAGGADVPLEQRILTYVQDHPTCSQRDVLDAIGGRWSDTQTAIGKLVVTGALANMGSGTGMKLVVPGADLLTGGKRGEAA